jgi:hypothetical protein
MINVMIAVMTGVMIVVRTTTTATTTTDRSILHHNCQKGATLMVRFEPPTEKSTLSLEVAKRPKATRNYDQMQGRSGTSILKFHNLYNGRSTQ